MESEIQTFIEFLLDTEATSEVSFDEAMSEKKQLYDKRYKSVFGKIVEQKLQQWKDCYEKEQSGHADRIVTNERFSDESEQDSSTSDDEEEDIPKRKKKAQVT